MTAIWISIIGMWFCIGMAFLLSRGVKIKIEHAFMPRKFIEVEKNP